MKATELQVAAEEFVISSSMAQRIGTVSRREDGDDVLIGGDSNDSLFDGAGKDFAHGRGWNNVYYAMDLGNSTGADYAGRVNNFMTFSRKDGIA